MYNFHSPFFPLPSHTLILPLHHSLSLFSLQVWLCWSGGPIRDQHYNLGVAGVGRRRRLSLNSKTNMLRVTFKSDDYFVAKPGFKVYYSLLVRDQHTHTQEHTKTHTHSWRWITSCYLGHGLKFFCHIGFSPSTTALLQVKCRFHSITPAWQ